MNNINIKSKMPPDISDNLSKTQAQSIDTSNRPTLANVRNVPQLGFPHEKKDPIFCTATVYVVKKDLKTSTRSHFQDISKIKDLLKNDSETLDCFTGLILKGKDFKSCSDYQDGLWESIEADFEGKFEMLINLSLSITGIHHDNKDIATILNFLSESFKKSSFYEEERNSEQNIPSHLAKLYHQGQNDRSNQSYFRLNFGRSLLTHRNFCIILNQILKLYKDFCSHQVPEISLKNENTILLLPYIVERMFNNRRLNINTILYRSDNVEFNERVEEMIELGKEVACAVNNFKKFKDDF